MGYAPGSESTSSSTPELSSCKLRDVMQGWRRVSHWMVIASIAGAACATVQSVETTTDTPLSPSVQHEVVDDSVSYETSGSVHGFRIRVALMQSETCATITTARSHRQRHVARHSDPFVARTTWVLAATALGAGAYSYVNADALAERADGPLAGAGATEYRQYGGGLLLLGVVATAIGIIDGVRASDSDFDDGVIEGTAKRRESTCRRRDVRNREVALLLPNGSELAGTTDRDGHVDFDLLTVPDEGLPTRDVRVEIGARQVAIDLSETQLANLRARLLAEPTSRLAIDALEKRKTACTSAVTTARASVAAEPADVMPSVRHLWSDAKSSCTDLWTSTLEQELLDVDRRIANTECRQRLMSADASFVEDTATTVEEMSDELQTIGNLCTAPEHVARRRQLEAKLAAAVKRIERQVAAEARRAAAEERQRVQRARAQRSFPDAEPAWSTPNTRTCCKYCSTGKACGNSCIARWKTCHKGRGCACD